jgi:hypothetical protein
MKRTFLLLVLVLVMVACAQRPSASQRASELCNAHGLTGQALKTCIYDTALVFGAPTESMGPYETAAPVIVIY